MRSSTNVYFARTKTSLETFVLPLLANRRNSSTIGPTSPPRQSEDFLPKLEHPNPKNVSFLTTHMESFFLFLLNSGQLDDSLHRCKSPSPPSRSLYVIKQITVSITASPTSDYCSRTYNDDTSVEVARKKLLQLLLRVMCFDKQNTYKSSAFFHCNKWSSTTQMGLRRGVPWSTVVRCWQTRSE